MKLSIKLVQDKKRHGSQRLLKIVADTVREQFQFGVRTPEFTNQVGTFRVVNEYADAASTRSPVIEQWPRLAAQQNGAPVLARNFAFCMVKRLPCSSR
jgi:hypothetical protein